ncbi:MAG TPA: hypothetical protein VK476_01355, partial [Flavobacterium sp.]|nr:hypothetical protein [Flavobacterium sp.]
TVSWEDYGARQTVFDDYDTLEHFSQVKTFQELIGARLSGGKDEAEEIAMLIEDLNPKLFNALGAAVRTLSVATNEEDFAQVGLSARRYLEQLADVLFPPRNVLLNGRKVGKAEYRNRIWAYIVESFSVNKDEEAIKSIGKETDRLVDEVNAILHSAKDFERTLTCFVDLAKLTILLLSLPSEKSRNAYVAYASNMEKLLNELLNKKEL